MVTDLSPGWTTSDVAPAWAQLTDGHRLELAVQAPGDLAPYWAPAELTERNDDGDRVWDPDGLAAAHAYAHLDDLEDGSERVLLVQIADEATRDRAVMLPDLPAIAVLYRRGLVARDELESRRLPDGTRAWPWTVTDVGLDVAVQIAGDRSPDDPEIDHDTYLQIAELAHARAQRRRHQPPILGALWPKGVEQPRARGDRGEARASIAPVADDRSRLVPGDGGGVGRPDNGAGPTQEERGSAVTERTGEEGSSRNSAPPAGGD
jgi:hypothetical protein